MGYSGYEILEFIDRSANRCKNPALNDPMTTYTDLMLKKKDDQETPYQRSQIKDTVQYAIKTKCGEWSHIIPTKNEKKWKGIFEPEMEHVTTEEQNLEPEKLEIVETEEVLEPPTPELEQVAPEVPTAAPITVAAPTDPEPLTISENIFNFLVLIFVPIVLLFQFYAMIF
ncbi:hypothetical protein CAEBREN_04185 [Caenorhabditis brenneri]|uniref:Uncharacterized protein n=1 Tax=Caenorhabditis brenneri TaxID=135651 RepID=G0N2Z2_CAEBE|nr:hypothetical protein CAEBREN_04185 [Caenorhabditis brenneri]